MWRVCVASTTFFQRHFSSTLSRLAPNRHAGERKRPCTASPCHLGEAWRHDGEAVQGCPRSDRSEGRAGQTGSGPGDLPAWKDVRRGRHLAHAVRSRATGGRVRSCAYAHTRVPGAPPPAHPRDTRIFIPPPLGKIRVGKKLSPTFAEINLRIAISCFYSQTGTLSAHESASCSIRPLLVLHEF